MKKNIFSLLILSIVLFVLAACSSDAGEEASSNSSEQANFVKVWSISHPIDRCLYTLDTIDFSLENTVVARNSQFRSYDISLLESRRSTDPLRTALRAS